MISATADVLVNNEGSVIMLIPNSTAGKAWIDENLQLESWQWLGGGAAIEWRYAPDIVNGMQEDGLEVIPGLAQVTEDDKRWLSQLGITASKKKKATEPNMPIRQDVATNTPNMSGVQQPPPPPSQVGVEESVALEQERQEQQQPDKEKHTIPPELPNAMFHMATDVEETSDEDLKDDYRGLGSASEFLQKAWSESTKNAVARGYMSGALDALRWSKRISVQEYGLGYDTYVYGGSKTAADNTDVAAYWDSLSFDTRQEIVHRSHLRAKSERQVVEQLISDFSGTTNNTAPREFTDEEAYQIAGTPWKKLTIGVKMELIQTVQNYMGYGNEDLGETVPEFDENSKAELKSMGIIGSSWGGWKRISRYTQESDDKRFTITLIDPTRISRWFLLKDTQTGRSYEDRTMTEAKLRAKGLREAENAVVEPVLSQEPEELKAASSPFTNGLLRSKKPEGIGEINEI